VILLTLPLWCWADDTCPCAGDTPYAYDCDGDGVMDSCDPCTIVTYNAASGYMLRGQMKTGTFSVTPASEAGNLTISVSGGNLNLVDVTIEEAQQKIDYKSIVENSDPASYGDELVWSIQASIPDKGIWSFTEEIGLKKGLDSVWGIAKDEAEGLLMSTDPGVRLGSHLRATLNDFSAVDQEGLVYNITSFRVNSVVNAVVNEVSSEWGSFVRSYLWSGIPMTSVESITVNESFSFSWNLDVEMQFTAGVLSLSPSLADAWKWVESVNDNGFSSELFNLQRTEATGSVSGNGETAAGVLSADLNFFVRIGHDAPQVSGGFEWGAGISVNLNF